MNLLGAALYDPAVAVAKATSSLLALTALDTTNLRLAITVPSHGLVTFHIRGLVTGATTVPTILIGVLNGATVLGRVTPTYENATANAATQSFVFDAEFTVSGLTPGAMNVDAAYAVQVLVASTNIKYGGPNTNAGANAWGGLVFEAWDPRPLPTAAPGAANGVQIAGANAATTVASLTITGALSVNGVSAVSQTGDAFARLGAAGAGLTALGDARIANLDAAVSSRSTFAGGAVASVTGAVGSVTADVGITQAAADKVWASAARSLTSFGTLVADIATAVWGATTRILTAGTNIALAKGTGLTGLNDISATAIVSGGAITTSAGKVSGVALVDTVTTYTGNTPQTGDSYARIGAAGAGLTAVGTGGADTTTVIAATNAIMARIGSGGSALTGLGDPRLANLDAKVSSRSTFGHK